jgi:hypothetical protein
MRCFLLILLIPLIAFAQYRCDWFVLSGGGGSVAGGPYAASATAAQAAVGQLTGMSYHAWIGFWQIDTLVVGVGDEMGPQVLPLKTELLPARPNPFSGHTQITYSLADENDVNLDIFDACGRMVNSFSARGQKPGRYSFTFLGCDERGRQVPKGIYFCRFRTRDREQVEKLVLTR